MSLLTKYWQKWSKIATLGVFFYGFLAISDRVSFSKFSNKSHFIFWHEFLFESVYGTSSFQFVPCCFKDFQNYAKHQCIFFVVNS